jgi:hypothetical protein
MSLPAQEQAKHVGLWIRLWKEGEPSIEGVCGRLPGKSTFTQKIQSVEVLRNL